MTAGIPAGLWLQMWGSQMQEDRVHDGTRAYISYYYNEYPAAVEVERNVLDLLNRLYDILNISGLDLEEIVREVEDEINDNGGIRYEGEYHKVSTFGPEEEDE
jgi:hypothetical protein